MSTPDPIPPFRPADPAHFAKQAPQFRTFLTWDQGALWALINSESAFQHMAAFSLRGLPAAASITEFLSPILAPLDEQDAEDAKGSSGTGNRARQAIGSMIRAVMEANGFRKTGIQRAVAPKPRRLFLKAEVFERIPLGEIPTNDEFLWDEYAKRASFATVSKLAPRLSIRALPSMYSPDRRSFYMSSLDVGVATTDEEVLRSMLRDVKAGYERVLVDSPRDHLRLAAYHGDFMELCAMLLSVAADPDEFEDPDMLLAA